MKSPSKTQHQPYPSLHILQFKPTPPTSLVHVRHSSSSQDHVGGSFHMLRPIHELSIQESAGRLVSSTYTYKCIIWVISIRRVFLSSSLFRALYICRCHYCTSRSIYRLSSHHTPAFRLYHPIYVTDHHLWYSRVNFRKLLVFRLQQ